MNQFSSEEREVFDVRVRFVSGTAVVAVRGEINVVTAAALAPSGGRLVVRSASSLVERPIDIVGLGNVDIEPPGRPRLAR